MPGVLANALTEEHAADLLRLEARELRRMRGIYEQGRKELLASLAEVRADTFTAQHLRSTQVQVESGIRAMLKKLEQGDTFNLLDTSIAQTLDEIAFYEPTFRGGATGRIQIEALRRIAAPQNLLLNQYRVSMESYGASLIRDVQGRLGVNLVKRSSWRQMSLDVAGKLDGNAIVGAQWKAERIVRTELVNALSVGHQVALETSAEILPGLKRQWDATLDSRTSSICETLNGRVREMNKPFGSYLGQPVMRPPAIPNCRSRMVPWHADWVDLDDTIDPGTAPKKPAPKPRPAPKPKPAPKPAPAPKPKPRKIPTKKIKAKPAPKPRQIPKEPPAPTVESLGGSTREILEKWGSLNDGENIAIAQVKNKFYSIGSGEKPGSFAIRPIESALDSQLGKQPRWSPATDPRSGEALTGMRREIQFRHDDAPVRRLLAEGKLEVELRPTSSWDKKGSGRVVHSATGKPLVEPPPKPATLKDAEKWARTHVADEVDFGGWSSLDGGGLREAREFNEAAYEVLVSKGRLPLGRVTTTDSFPHWADAGYGTRLRFRKGFGTKDLLSSRARAAKTYSFRRDQLVKYIERERAVLADPAKDATSKKWAQRNLKRLERDLAQAPDRHNVLTEIHPMRDVVTHELGHIVHQRMPQGMMHGYKELGGTSKGFQQQIQGKIGIKGKREIASPVSDYASTNTHEVFAESFAAYHLGGAERGRVASGVLRIIEEVLAGGY